MINCVTIRWANYWKYVLLPIFVLWYLTTTFSTGCRSNNLLPKPWKYRGLWQSVTDQQTTHYQSCVISDSVFVLGQYSAYHTMEHTFYDGSDRKLPWCSILKLQNLLAGDGRETGRKDHLCSMSLTDDWWRNSVLLLFGSALRFVFQTYRSAILFFLVLLRCAIARILAVMGYMGQVHTIWLLC